jgi:hypothetical protein
MAARHEQQLVRRSAPVRTHHDDVVVGEDDALAGGDLGPDRGAQHTTADEASERALFVEHFARHERQAEQLPVGVRQ